MARVLVVDADEDFRESLRLILETARYEARAFGDPDAALPLVAPGVHVVVDAEAPDLGAAFATSGARVIGMRKPFAPAALLAALR